MGSLYTSLDLDYVKYKMDHFTFRVTRLNPNFTVFRKEEQMLRNNFDKLVNIVNAWDRLKDLNGLTTFESREVHTLLRDKNEVLNALDVLSQRLDMHFVDWDWAAKSFESGVGDGTATPILKRLEDFSE